MTLVARKFGTDLSNQKGPKNPKRSTKPTKQFEGGENLANGAVPIQKTCEKVLSAPIPTASKETIGTPQQLRTDAPEFVISITEPKSASPLQYDRDFLLQFQNICTEPLQGILAEVIRGQYVKPIFHPSPKRSTQDASSPVASPIKIVKAYSARVPSNATKLPSSGSLPSTPTKLKPSAWNVASPIATGGEESQGDPITPIAMPLSPLASKSTSVSSPIVAIPFDIGKIVKSPKPKSTRPRETDPKRIAARLKQLEIGMNTVGYKVFTTSVPQSQRTKEHPRIPDPYQICSKRSWDGQVRKWRRMLHDYDPIEMQLARQQELAEKKAGTQDAAGHEEDGEYVNDDDVPTLEMKMLN